VKADCGSYNRSLPSVFPFTIPSNIAMSVPRQNVCRNNPACSLSTWLLAVLVCLLPSIVYSEENVLERFKAKSFESSTQYVLPYRQLDPLKVAEGKKYPLVIFLHGAGERGDNNQAQLVHGMKDFASDAIMQKYPAFVIAPQCPENQKWADVDWSGDKHLLTEKPSPSMAATLELIEMIKGEFPIDTNRIYITGLSMGGFGTWDLISRHPEMFAAAVPICGGGDSRDEIAKKIKDVPVWAVHGDQDPAVKVQRTREMIAAIKTAGGQPMYTELKGVGHDSWTETYSNPELYAWLFSQSLEQREKK
jgi:predicted peptidase